MQIQLRKVRINRTPNYDIGQPMWWAKGHRLDEFFRAHDRLDAERTLLVRFPKAEIQWN